MPSAIASDWSTSSAQACCTARSGRTAPPTRSPSAWGHVRTLCTILTIPERRIAARDPRNFVRSAQCAGCARATKVVVVTPLRPLGGRMGATPRTPELELRGITVTFGGLTALSDVGLAVAPAPGARRDRPQRRRQDHALQRRLRLRPPRRRTHRPRAARTLTGCARTTSPAWAWPAPCRVSACSTGSPCSRTSWSARTATPAPASSAPCWPSPGPPATSASCATGREAVLDRLGIAEYADRYPPSLPYPVRKRVALARALAAEPDLLLLDEPASGLSSSGDATSSATWCAA